MQQTVFTRMSVKLLASAALFVGVGAAQAATLGVTIYTPDLATSNATLTYDFTSICSGTSGNGSSGTGECGTDNGLNGQNKITYSTFEESLSGGLLTVTGTSMTIDAYDPSTGLDFIIGGTYTLTANFDGSGSFVDGTVLATGTSFSGDVNFQSGTLISADLSAFGYGGTDAAGTMDFLLANITGDMAAFGDVWGGIIINTTTLSPATGNWDTGGLDFTADFSASGVAVNTTVPVPAAVWLFGSGLIGLIGLGRRLRGQKVVVSN